MKKNVVLDLDNTLISAEALEDFPFDKGNETKMRDKALHFAIHNMDDYYIIFERPHLQHFLDWLFKNYNVSIWTAATKDYALFIVKEIILNHKNRKLDYIFFSYHCDISKKKFKSTKDLRLLWDTFQIPNYNSKNTILIDDLEPTIEPQQDNAILIKSFEILEDKSEDDNELMKVIIPQIKEKFLKLNKI